VDTYRLVSEVLDYVFSNIGRYAGDFHEIEVEIAFRMLYAADTDLVSVHECEYMELLVLGVLLADFLKFETAEGDIHLWIFTEDILFPSFSLCIQTWLLNDIVRIVRVVDYRISSVLVYTVLSEISVDRTLLAVKVKTQIVIHLICI
jgi:hypothetical protein